MTTETRPKFWFSFVDNDNFPKEVYYRIELQCIIELEPHVYLAIDSCDATYVVPKGESTMEKTPPLFHADIPFREMALMELEMVYAIRRLLRTFKIRAGFARLEIENGIMRIVNGTEKPYLQHVKDCASGKDSIFNSLVSSISPIHAQSYCVAPGANVEGCNFDGNFTIAVQNTRC